MEALGRERVHQPLVHRLDVENRLIAIHCIHLSFYRPQCRAWISGRTHDQCHSRKKGIVPKTFAPINQRCWFHAQRASPDVPYYSHDRPPQRVILVEINALSQRIFRRENLSGERFVHYDRIRGIGCITRIEYTSAPYRNPQRLKKTAADHRHVALWPLRDRYRRAAEDLKRHHLVWLLRPQRQVRGYCRALHRRKLLHSLQYVVIKTSLCVSPGITGSRQIYS